MGRTRHEADLTRGRKQLRELICLLRRAVVEKGSAGFRFAASQVCIIAYSPEKDFLIALVGEPDAFA